MQYNIMFHTQKFNFMIHTIVEITNFSKFTGCIQYRVSVIYHGKQNQMLQDLCPFDRLLESFGCASFAFSGVGFRTS